MHENFNEIRGTDEWHVFVLLWLCCLIGNDWKYGMELLKQQQLTMKTSLGIFYVKILKKKTIAGFSMLCH